MNREEERQEDKLKRWDEIKKKRRGRREKKEGERERTRGESRGGKDRRWEDEERGGEEERGRGEDKLLFVCGKGLLLTRSIKGFASMSSQPLSNCHQTFLKIKETFHTLSVTSALFLCLSLNNTDTHTFHLEGKKEKARVFGGSPKTSHWTNWTTFHLLHNSHRLYSVDAIGKSREVTFWKRHKREGWQGGDCKKWSQWSHYWAIWLFNLRSIHKPGPTRPCWLGLCFTPSYFSVPQLLHQWLSNDEKEQLEMWAQRRKCMFL